MKLLIACSCLTQGPSRGRRDLCRSSERLIVIIGSFVGERRVEDPLAKLIVAMRWGGLDEHVLKGGELFDELIAGWLVQS